jgi:DNA polymerase-4
VAARWILHADMDAFYASVEQRDRPELRGKPVIVGANSPRGVVSAASYEARKFGVHSAMPGFRAHELCPHGVFLAGDMAKYASVSRDVHRVFAEFTNEIEPLALDEAFMDISGSLGLFGEPLEIGRRIKQRVRETTQLAVSVGIGPNKLVAKIACGMGKPDGLLLVRPEDVERTLAPLPIRKLWGIGPQAEKALIAVGIRTFRDLASAHPHRAQEALGPHFEEFQRRARGIDDRPVESERAPKSIGEEATFESDVTDQERISGTLTAHAEAVASRARRAGYLGRTITLKIKLGRATGRRTSRTAEENEPIYPLLSRSVTLPSPTNDGVVIRRAALDLWKKAAVSEPVRLLGVSLSNLAEPAGEQLELFAPRAVAVPTAIAKASDVAPNNTRGNALGKILDAITDRFGSGAVRRAVDAPKKVTQGDRFKAGDTERDVRKPSDDE